MTTVIYMIKFFLKRRVTWYQVWYNHYIFLVMYHTKAMLSLSPGSNYSFQVVCWASAWAFWVSPYLDRPTWLCSVPGGEGIYKES